MLYTFFHNSRIYLLVTGSIAVLAIAAIGATTYRGAVAQEERKLIERAETILLSLEPREIAFLTSDASDIHNPFYINLKKKLANIIAVNEDIRFVYLAGKRAETIFLYMDSEPENSPDYSPPGQVYGEASAVFHDVFETGLPRFEGPLADRWGEWISAFVAINHPRTGERLAVLGIDIDAFEYRKRILFAMAIPLLFISVLFLVFLLGYVRYRKEEEILYLKAEFLSVAAHDLRAPLTGVLWAIEALRTDLAKKTTARNSSSEEKLALVAETIGKVEYTLQFMKESVQGILESSHLLYVGGRNEPARPANIPEIIANIVLGLQFTARECDVSVFVASTLGKDKDIRTPASAEKVRHIFSNIISNAIKYSKNHGRVDVAYSLENDRHIVSIEDRGIGIPENDQKRIFSGNFRARNAPRARAGAGLGLYLIKRLADECGGRIWFASEENKGTKFYIELPVSKKI